jgi:hypothetical protein
MTAYWVAAMWVDFGGYYRVVVFATGFSWSFHFLLNLFILGRGQEDLRLSGRFLSIAVIVLFNVIVLGLMMVFVSEGITLKGYVSGLGKDVACFYAAVFRVLSGAPGFRR